MWRVGAKLLHPYNPELGVGVVREVEGRFLTVHFPDAQREVRLAAEGSGLEPLVLRPGTPVRLVPSGERAEIATPRRGGYVLADGREVAEEEVWPLIAPDSPVERLAQLRLDPPRALANRIEGLRLRALREAGGLGSFLGGRIELFPHQLYTARRAVERDPVRWLLADEVGLGKTVEACLVTSALIRTGRARRVLVVAPNTLTVQWLGELYRKFHQVFALLDRERLDSVAGTHGPGVNPFETHPLGVVALELLASDRRLLGLALDSEPDLLIVDEAHRLTRSTRDAAVRPLVSRARHAVLLTATPLQADRRGFHQLVSLLHPDAFPAYEHFERAVREGTLRLPCTSAVQRADLGGLPPRRPRPVDLGPALDDPRTDPRAQWIAEQLPSWREAGEKALVFVRDVDALERLKRFLETRTRTRVLAFHEKLGTAQRDIEVASFRDGRAPVMLCSEAGAEGRNFQFCDRMVHHDLPLDPVALEQRIGRLDRIGRRRDVEIVYFRCAGAMPDVARLYEALDLFSRPSAGLDQALGVVREALAEAARVGRPIEGEVLGREIATERARAEQDLPRVFYADAYEPARAAEILSAVPPDLEARTQSFCLGALRELGLELVDKGGRATWYVELGPGALVDALPDVPGGSRFLGTFDRAEAVLREEIDFFASGHPLVEGLLGELEDGPRGRAALLEIPARDARGAGVLGVLREGASLEIVALDLEGIPRPEWTERVLAALPGLPDAAPPAGAPDAWASRIRALAEALLRLHPTASLDALAFFRFVPR